MHKYVYNLTKILLVLLCAAVYAPDLYCATSTGGEPGSFLKFGQGARALGIGGAYVAGCDDASAIYWNPSALSKLERKEISAFHAILWEDTLYNFVGYAHPTTSFGSFGAGIVQLASKGFEKRASLTATPTDFNVVNQAFFLSSSIKMLGKFATGVSLKLVKADIDGKSATSLGGDIGLSYRSIDESLSLGINLQNILSPSLKIQNSSDSYPMTIKSGITYGFDMPYTGWDDTLNVACDIDYSTYSQFKTHLGLEYITNDTYALRIGKDAQDNITFGLGYNISDFMIDYAAGFHELGLSHRLSVGYRFGYIGEAQYGPKAVAKRLEELNMQGTQYYESQKYAKALSEWEKALIWDPSNKEILEKVENANKELETRVNNKLLEERITQAYTLYEQGNLVESLEKWKEVHKLDPSNKRAEEFVQKITSQLTKEEEEIYIERKKEKDIIRIAELLSSGDKLYDKGDYINAIKAWEDILKIKEDHLQAKKKIADLIEKMDKMIKEKYEQGVVHYNAGEYGKAIEAFKTVLNQDALHKDAKDYLQKSRQEVKKKQVIEKIDAKQIDQMYYKAADLYLKGRYSESVDVLQKLIKLDPGNENADKLLTKAASVLDVMEKK